jgi:hypothetical protein
MEQLFHKLLRTKHKEWSYEDEYRLVRPLKNCDPEGNNFFAVFSDKTLLKEVILGARYRNCQLEELASDLKSVGVKFQTARAEFKGFRMTPQNLDSLQKQL